MSTAPDSRSAQLLDTPLTPWLVGPDEQDDELSTLVRGEAAAPKTIIALQRFLELSGRSPQRHQWESLVRVAALDLAVARMLEPHLDALGILAEAGMQAPDPHSTWGVYAAEAPGKQLAITEGTPSSEGNGGIVIDGEKAWCSLAAELSHAIVTVRRGESAQAVAVPLDHPGVRPEPAAWPSLGLREIPSSGVVFDQVPAEAVGPPGWYLERPSFAWGGIRVAACWFGGALALARGAARRQLARSGPTPLGDMALGCLDAEIFTVRSILSHAAAATDGSADTGEYTRAQAWTLALRVRNVIYRSCQRIQQQSRELAGPAALTGDAAFAKADADLTVYLSQHHGPRDEESLGADVAEEAARR